MKKGILKNEKGVSLVLLALSIVVLFGFAALAIDVGHLYNVKNQLQVAADAAALAGAAKLIGNDTLQHDARAEAMKIAGENVADIAGTVIDPYKDGSYDQFAGGAGPGDPIPIALQPNDSNADPNGDIIVGYWNGSTFTFNNASTINAIKVVARRNSAADDRPYQPRVNNWFAKVFSLLPGSPDFSISNVAATAIAAKGKLPFLPIAVNEYWDEGECDAGGCPTGDPYNQKYPESFMRAVNADAFGPVPPVPPSTSWAGKTFAIIGTRANSNESQFNAHSFVDIFYRNENHSPLPDEWHVIQQSASTGNCDSGCDGVNITTTGKVGSGNVNPGKYDEDFQFLFTGIPDNIIPPNAVREIVRTDLGYTVNNYNATNGNDPSNCPYATIPYFSSSGNINQPLGPDGIRFCEKWPAGSQFIVMVYDGTHTTDDPASPANQANVVTVVGYGVIELDGYLSGPMQVDASDNPTNLGDCGNTAYGHAIPHRLSPSDVDPNVVDVSDPYIIQPPLDPVSARSGTCSFTDALRKVQNSFGTVRLVDPSLHYGVH